MGRSRKEGGCCRTSLHASLTDVVPRKHTNSSFNTCIEVETAKSISPVPAAEEAGDRSANPGPKEGGEAAVAAAASASSTSVHRQRPFKAGDLQATDAIPIGNGEIQAGHSDFEAGKFLISSFPVTVAREGRDATGVCPD